MVDFPALIVSADHSWFIWDTQSGLLGDILIIHNGVGLGLRYGQCWCSRPPQTCTRTVDFPGLIVSVDHAWFIFDTQSGLLGDILIIHKGVGLGL
ncbi:hypothetical protein CEXT_417911 [Caerostris extrusa]|uniref:Uncharacterized protein n=1 Tax=Caerostris extrusa TaxID=172846 RepID=A0AAV4SC98_CAEEX|nr:hypothetical protein CEXT_417911 [Caerostris extrusa]